MADFIADPQAPARTTVRIAEVPAVSGWNWFAQAWELYLRQPATWSLIVLAYFGLAMACNFVPFIGSLVFLFVAPILIAGMYIGAQALDKGEGLKVATLFSAFNESAGNIVLLLLASWGIMIAYALLLTIIALALQASGVFHWEAMSEQAMTLTQGLKSGTGVAPLGIAICVLFMLLIALLLTPVIMLSYFALPLIALRRTGVIDSMKLSFRACYQNWLPLSVYFGVILAATTLIAAAFVVIAVFGANGGGLIGMGIALALLGLLVGLIALFVLLPYMTLLMYCAVREIFPE